MVELVSNDYGLMDENEENENFQNEFFMSTNNSFNSIVDKLINLQRYNGDKNAYENNILITCLENTMNINSNIILFNCVIPWKFPLKQSSNSSKFISMIYIQINELNKKKIIIILT